MAAERWCKMSNILLCFINDINYGNLFQYIEKMDGLGFEIHLYENIQKLKIQPYDIISELDSLKTDKTANLLFLTDCEKLFCTVYRLYHQIFDKFLYFHNPGEFHYELDKSYEQVLKLEIDEKEELYKPIYTNYSEILHSLKTGDKISFDQLFDDNTANGPVQKRVKQKYYFVDNHYVIFEPLFSNDKVIVNKTTDGKQSCSNTEYIYVINYEVISRVFEHLQDNFNVLAKEGQAYFDFIGKYMDSLPWFQRQMFLIILNDWDYIADLCKPFEAILLLSFLAKYTNEAIYYERILSIALNSERLKKSECYFLYQQIKTVIFKKPHLSTPAINGMQTKLYEEVFKYYESIFSDKLHRIPHEYRDEELVIIIIYQFLNELHPPTHTALERAYNLVKYMHKKVMIINTHENITTYGGIPFYFASAANYVSENDILTKVTYKDLVIPFYQVPIPMPSEEGINKVLNVIIEAKPYFILNIGGSSITADICGKLVPELSMGVVFSNLPRTAGDISIIGKRLTKKEWDNLLNAGCCRDNIIESTFTFELASQKSKVSREDLDLPENSFIMVVVGKRLNDDITEEYIEAVARTFPYNTHIVFAGDFSNYDRLSIKYPILKNHSTNLGYYPDILALMEVCDLYVNPKRMGGGFSIAEAFSKGVPGVTMNFGDIASAAGSDFWVKDYNEMVQMIFKYMHDSDFYKTMSHKAKERAVVLTDSYEALKEIVKKAEKSKYFF